MKRFVCAAAVAAVTAFVSMPVGATPFTISYQLNNVAFLDGGTASGYFTADFDPSLMGNGFYQLVAVDIVTTAGTVLPGAHYNDASTWQSSVQGPVKQIGTSGPYFSAMVLGFVTPDLANSLIFNFDQAIPVTPSTTLQLIATDPYPGERTNNVWRMLGSGSLVPVTEVSAPVTVPEPQTWLTIVTGLGLMGLALGRRCSQKQSTLPQGQLCQRHHKSEHWSHRPAGCSGSSWPLPARWLSSPCSLDRPPA